MSQYNSGTKGQLTVAPNGSGYSALIDASAITAGRIYTLPDTSGTLSVGGITGTSVTTDNAVVRWDGTVGGVVQNSVVTVADTTGSFSVPNGWGLTSAGTIDIAAGGDGNALTITTPNGTTNSSTGGDLNATLGNASTSGGNAIGGTFNLTAGNGFGSSGGGKFNFTSGNGGATGVGGQIQFTAGNGGATSGKGGDLVFYGGSATNGGSDGGDIYIVPGNKNGGGTDGKLLIGNHPTSPIYAILDRSLLATSNKTFTFPNVSGTFALTGLTGTKVYYVADSSGGAVTRKLTFTDGILTAET